MRGCATEEPDGIGAFDCYLEDVGAANGTRIETSAGLRAWAAKVSLHRRVKAVREMELQRIAHICSCRVWAEDKATLTNIDDDCLLSFCEGYNSHE